MAYLLDANVFIQAKRLHYGLDFCPAFWKWLVAENAAGRVVSIDKVSDEIEAGGDDLWDWAKAQGQKFFLKPDAALPAALVNVSTWTMGQGYEQAAVNMFLQVADYYLVGHALSKGDIVVTHEIPSTSKKRIKIPDACLGLNVKFVTPFEMLRTSKARFVLPGTP
ncbi:MAG: hypothetical protein A3G81_12445 [Betaproteobacteria bacterium RIFCSPLOWO2_12_FULL_65_14]|nr:MAG: hypothetical protein A3G81_12445 [Betaproteobacteria bacterium RIFCSPLOWO2_12_FULL_65_14]